jgi:imidazolonepropionase-like amidohydrolase
MVSWRRVVLSVLLAPCALSAPPALAALDATPALLLRDVRVFDGIGPALSGPTDVLVRGAKIERIGPGLEGPGGGRVIDGRGRTLMPGLIDVHVHMTFGAMDMATLQSPTLTPEAAQGAAVRGAGQMLLRGFTSVRDMGGPIFPLKAAIDRGAVPGPRIWPSGAHISQTAGHGDLRAPDEPPRRFTGQLSRAERMGATWIADGRDEVLVATRENLRFGASQIKLMAGGGTSSDYDPLDVTQYTLDELRAAVDAAEDWNTYVTVHAYTPRAVRRAIEAGVKCIEHGQLLDDATLALMADKGVWLSLQMLQGDSESMDPARRLKRRPVIEAQRSIWGRARAAGVKLAWGSDILFDPAVNAQQASFLVALREVGFSPAEILKLATHDNAQLLALSGPRSPYAGTLGVVREGALADLILVDGDPLADLDLIADPATHFDLILKDGVIVKEQP